MSKRVHRRAFLRRAAATGAGLVILTSWAPGQSPNEKLDIAIVGVAGRGGGNLAGVAHENIVALCDVDKNSLAAAAKGHPQAKTYADFRKMLGEMDKQIDAVVVSTPDHTHAVAGVMAMKMGKHCYCEKPLTHDVYEARVMADLAVKNKLATQMGTQIHAEDNYRRVVELVQCGAIGPIREVHVWCGASYVVIMTPPAMKSPRPIRGYWPTLDH